MRFVAPLRDALPGGFAEHPALADFPHAPALVLGDWPTLAGLNALLGRAHHAVSGSRLQFVAQDAALMADGLHYEARIFEQGLIATRERNWHDVFNALMWLDRQVVKCAVNAAYTRDLPMAPASGRNRRQAALTHFDEAGAMVMLDRPELLDAWDRHDWSGLFRHPTLPWSRHARLVLFGHALLEHLLLPTLLPVAKCLVVRGDLRALPELPALLAQAIQTGELLNDPQDLRPLPLAGIPGWHAHNEEPAFYHRAPCFRPLRPGRRYPTPQETRI